MGTEGLEPSRTITRQRILSPSCLPIPPRPLMSMHTYSIFIKKIQEYFNLYLEAAPRFELGIEDLQSPALPLGHIARKVLTLVS